MPIISTILLSFLLTENVRLSLSLFFNLSLLFSYLILPHLFTSLSSYRNHRNHSSISTWFPPTSLAIHFPGSTSSVQMRNQSQYSLGFLLITPLLHSFPNSSHSQSCLSLWLTLWRFSKLYIQPRLFLCDSQCIQNPSRTISSSLSCDSWTPHIPNPTASLLGPDQQTHHFPCFLAAAEENCPALLF